MPIDDSNKVVESHNKLYIVIRFKGIPYNLNITLNNNLNIVKIGRLIKIIILCYSCNH